ncbi:MAG TPA: M48 family metalloprotease [Desulfobacteraceae bacterium]|nr:M48 family metalloprotease [Desulfobacteraceae bacterium]HPJ66429.1 M48 family metalloprotease [Desulfobacteraceae bacterium]
MKSGRFKNTKLIIFATVLCLLFSQESLFSPKALALSIEEEKTMGQEFLAQMKKYYEMLDDYNAEQILNDLGQYLVKPVETKNFEYHFYIIKDNTLNAFASPGGHIFLYSGLIDTLESIDELASVICHEIGHISARHISERIEQNKMISIATIAGILAGVLIGGEAAGALMTGSVAAGLQAQLHFSREDEYQADQLGFKYMKAAGFDPEGMITVLKRIEKEDWLGAGRRPAYLLTHPTGPERMANLDSMLSSYIPERENNEAERYRKLFPFFKTIVMARSLEPRDSKKRFEREFEKNPSSYLAHYGMGIVCIETSEYAAAIQHLNNALEKGHKSAPLLTRLAEAYIMSGKNKQAISVLEDALKLDKDDKAALFLSGLSYENLKQYQEAINFYERLSSMQPGKDNVYYHLGVCYGKLNNLALAHYNFGLYFWKSGETEKSRFHFQKADKLADGDASLKRRIKKAEEDLP